LSKNTVHFYEDLKTFSKDTSQTVEKRPILQCRKSFKTFLDPKVDDFQNFNSSSLSTDKYVAKFSRRSDQYFYIKLLTGRRTNTQTDSERPDIT